MNNSFFVKTLLVFFLLKGVIWGAANQKNDVQFWAMQHFKYELSPKSSVYFQTEFRWGDDAAFLYFSYLQTGLNYSFCEWLSAGPGYRQASAVRQNRLRVTIYQPFFDVSLKFKLGKWQLHDRNRIEHIFVDSEPNLWLYRNRVHLISPWKFGKIEFNPFINEEAFFIERRGYFQQRVAVGGRFKLSKSVSSDLFYMLRYIKIIEEWRPTHAIGAYLFFFF